ncbi:TetR/AcrR family transcriptional regulator [Rhodococcus sp. G-MC3]|uniref:TetR/AcrR family transcriptional regulator n=1 Tax=Rhodococcus sp. G-MC3 TaxID=3046209 RepID=UPI0024BA6E33|nr:TetR/AcrR family transcriptional regulator [Rhodococcus sp. G-MC3]MDJ0392426.1 TetR/AcrR family transcriptional regulator [Rhodococcus sp. G-MC3]
MARPSKFSVEQILDAAALACVEHWRDTTIAHVAAAVGAPTGSIYHRFDSRDALFGTLWVRAINRFHEGLLTASRIDDPFEAMASLAREIPRFCRANPHDAKAMTLYRKADLARLVPESMRDTVASINDDIDVALRATTARRYGRFTDRRYRLALLATRQGPYGLIRPIVGEFIPREFDAICVASAEGILALGD